MRVGGDDRKGNRNRNKCDYICIVVDEIANVIVEFLDLTLQCALVSDVHGFFELFVFDPLQCDWDFSLRLSTRDINDLFRLAVFNRRLFQNCKPLSLLVGREVWHTCVLENVFSCALRSKSDCSRRFEEVHILRETSLHGCWRMRGNQLRYLLLKFSTSNLRRGWRETTKSIHRIWCAIDR